MRQIIIVFSLAVVVLAVDPQVHESYEDQVTSQSNVRTIRRIPKQQDPRQARYLQQQRADTKNLLRNAPPIHRKADDRKITYSDKEISELASLIGKQPEQQLKGLEKLLQSNHTERTYQVPQISSSLALGQLQDALNPVAKAQVAKALADAEQEAFAHVQAQHQAIAKAQADAQRTALEQIALHNQGLKVPAHQGVSFDYLLGLQKPGNQFIYPSDSQHQSALNAPAVKQFIYPAEPQFQAVLKAQTEPGKQFIYASNPESQGAVKTQAEPKKQDQNVVKRPRIKIPVKHVENHNLPVALPLIKAQTPDARLPVKQDETQTSPPKPLSFQKPKTTKKPVKAPKLDVVKPQKAFVPAPKPSYDDVPRAIQPQKSQEVKEKLENPVAAASRVKEVIQAPAHSYNVRGVYNGDEEQYAAQYAFGYKVRDENMGNEFGHEEKREGENAAGVYHVVLPDGRLQKVEYYADDTGYHAKVFYQKL